MFFGGGFEAVELRTSGFFKFQKIRTRRKIYRERFQNL